MKTQNMSLDEIRTAGMKALAQELGPAGLIRFIQLFDRGDGDYSRERHTLLAARDSGAIATEIALLRPKRRR